MENRVLLMQCACNDEGLAECEKNVEEAKTELEIGPLHDFYDNVVMSLVVNYDVDVSFGADQWFGVFAKTKEWELMVPCDSLKYGLAALYLYCVKSVGKRGYCSLGKGHDGDHSLDGAESVLRCDEPMRYAPNHKEEIQSPPTSI